MRPHHLPSSSGSRLHEIQTLPAGFGFQGGRPILNRYSSLGSPGMLASTQAGSFDGTGQGLMGARPDALPYALVPAIQTFPFGEYMIYKYVLCELGNLSKNN